MNDAPVATPQALTLDEDTSRPLTLAGSDVDGDTLVFSVVSGPANGALTGAPPNLTYTPNPNFFGADSFVFRVSDAQAAAQATVSLTVSDVPEQIPSPTIVVWTSAVGVSVSANNLTKTGVAGWNAGAVSTQSLPSGNGAVQFTASETTSRRMLGLNRGSLNQSYTELDFAFSLGTAGRLYIYENGSPRAITTYATGDTLQIAVEGGVVRYRRNGTLIYTSRVAPSYPLAVDTSLYDPGATLLDARLTGGWQ